MKHTLLSMLSSFPTLWLKWARGSCRGYAVCTAMVSTLWMPPEDLKGTQVFDQILKPVIPIPF